MPRVLYLGENWFGSCARACGYALRRLGCEVLDVDTQAFVPQGRSLQTRAAVRLLMPSLIRDYNAAILRAARSLRPEVLIAFKAPLVEARTLQELRGQGVKLYNYYPDTSAFAHGRLLREALPEYDCVFYTKRFWDRDVSAEIQLRDSRFLAHGYDPELHRAAPVHGADPRLDRDVCVIATHTPYKETILSELVARLPELDLAIWGNGWERARTPALRPFVRREPLLGPVYAEALRRARINLAVMSGRVEGASQGDETTTRTFEIPACGGFMLHERSGELAELFEEGREVACFDSAAELVEKIRHYLAHPEERATMAAAGHARCVPAYAYDRRMQELLEWHAASTRTPGGHRQRQASLV